MKKSKSVLRREAIQRGESCLDAEERWKFRQALDRGECSVEAYNSLVHMQALWIMLQEAKGKVKGSQMEMFGFFETNGYHVEEIL